MRLTMPLRVGAVFALVLIFTCAGSARPQDAVNKEDQTAAAKPPPREQFFRTLVVEQGDTAGDLSCLFCSIVVRGTVEGEATAVWGNVEVQGAVQGEAVAAGGSVRLRAGSHVTEGAVAVGGSVLRDPGSTLDGEAVSLWYLFFPRQRELRTLGLVCYFALQFLLVLLVFGMLRARRVHAISRALPERPGLTILFGVVITSVVTLGLGVFDFHGWLDDAVTFGLPALMFLITMPGCVGISLLLGRVLGRMLGHSYGPVATALVGAAILAAITAIPLVGLFVSGVAVILASGATLATLFGLVSEPAGQGVSPAS